MVTVDFFISNLSQLNTFLYRKSNFVKRLSPIQWHSLQIMSITMSGSFQFKRLEEQWKISGLGHYLLLYVWWNIIWRRRKVATYISCNNMAANTAVLMSSYLSIVAQTFLLNKEKYGVFDWYQKAFHCLFVFLHIKYNPMSSCNWMYSYINIVS